MFLSYTLRNSINDQWLLLQCVIFCPESRGPYCYARGQSYKIAEVEIGKICKLLLLRSDKNNFSFPKNLWPSNFYHIDAERPTLSQQQKEVSDGPDRKNENIKDELSPGHTGCYVWAVDHM